MLICALGFKEADGAMLNAIKLSQDHDGLSFDASRLLPKEWIDALLSTGLAEGSPTAFYVKGSKEYHNWITKQRESARRGGMANKNKINKLPEASGYPVAEPSSSSSSSYSYSTSNNNENFEFQYSKEYQDLQKIVEQHFNSVPIDFRKHAKEIYTYYEKDLELFRQDLVDVVDASKKLNDASKKRNYVKSAILRKIGVIRERQNNNAVHP